MDTVTAWLECFCNQSEFTLQCHSEHKLYLAKFAGTVGKFVAGGSISGIAIYGFYTSLYSS